MIKRHGFNKHAPKPEQGPYAEGTLKDLRLKLGMTQKELGAVIGYSEASISVWEHSNSAPTEVIQKLRKIYKDTKDRIVDDGIDIIKKVSYIRHRLGVSYDRLAQLMGVEHGTTVKGWMDGRKPRMKYIAEINRMYYELKGQHKPKPQKRRLTFCRLDPLDRSSWKAEIESPVIVWR
ncbi:TPA: helix-turn-helix transcriptional regulator [Streptococcus suis]|nr:helix-turn-helix transcriptional regulator [Streptococcus suis]HEM2764534.1 helix-turn-helix transcriptional regulator [Streptococcus suis]HEM3574404.1 helix-turn-helix transcriptional regulator [Streptococcus suis]HEM3585447.1 helix-turn-helix transcriptional regulator [Streptococcus suis]